MTRQIFILIFIITSCSQNTNKDNPTKTVSIDNRYFKTKLFDFGFRTEVEISQDIYKNLVRSGLKEYQLLTYSIDFISDKKEKLDSLANFLIIHYKYKIKEIKKEEDGWILYTAATPFPVDSNTFLYWVIDMYVLGYNFDCRIKGYGPAVHTGKFPDLSKNKAAFYFDEGTNAYNNKNKSSAIINWTNVLKIEPNNTNALYSRAKVKNELYLLKDALNDYDKAIEIAPKFTEAITNRAKIKEKVGDYDGAISDYSRVIELDPKNAMAYFNRGNSNLKNGDKASACADWKKAKELGVDYVNERLIDQCK